MLLKTVLDYITPSSKTPPVCGWVLHSSVKLLQFAEINLYNTGLKLSRDFRKASNHILAWRQHL